MPKNKHVLFGTKMIALLLGSMVFCMYCKTSGPATNLLSEVWKKQWDFLCCMHLLHLFLETCPTKNNQTWNCAFLLYWQFLVYSLNLSTVYCDETWLSISLSIFNEFNMGTVSWNLQFILCPRLSFKWTKVSTLTSGKPFDLFWPALFRKLLFPPRVCSRSRGMS